jgi:exopolyphosphatase / guanosine-5'-triphosphate,3'-diphosphate pyrophosphatase
VTTVAVVDIGTNSTRLLLAEVGDGSLRELARDSIVTRLGEGVDATGRLGDEPMGRVFAALDSFAADIERASVRTAVMTSAVRDAANGAEFAGIVRDRYGLEAATLSGDEEARLTSLGATVTRAGDDTVLVIDIGGGSTELVVGSGADLVFHISTQVGVVRHSERYLHTDPPTADELAALMEDARGVFEAAVPEGVRSRPVVGIGVGGTATQLASIDLELVEHDRDRIEGHAVSRERLEELRDRLAALPLAERRDVTGLDPARAPTIVAGATILREVLGAFALDGFEASERDILWGVALDAEIA